MTEHTDTTALGSGGVYSAIREQILSGELLSGAWLREGDLAANLGVSRTPVREAFRRLAAEGLVQVRAWSMEDLEEIYALRTELEPWGCGLAAASGTVDLEELAVLASAMDAAAEGALDLDRITELNNRFHRMILDASGNARLAAIVPSLVQVPLVWRTFSHYSPETLRRSLAHHHEIVVALATRDSVWAESVMRSHVRNAWQSIRQRMGENETRTKPA